MGWSVDDLREVWAETAARLPEEWQLGGVTFAGPREDPAEWVAFLIDSGTSEVGGPEGWGATPLKALEALAIAIREQESTWTIRDSSTEVSG